MNKYLFLLTIVLLLASCAPSETSIQTAIAETQAALPTTTSTTLPTSTLTPSPTPDVRVIDVNPETLLLTKAQLPPDAKYYLPGPGWISPHLNSEVIAQFGIAEGQEYVERTGRVTGWWVYYDRGTNVVIAPQEIFDNIMLFKTHVGAMIYLEEYSTCNDTDSVFTKVDSSTLIGDASVACIYREMQPSGEYKITYLVSFVYKNIAHQVSGWGWERDVRYEYVDQIAENLISLLQIAPLSDQVTFTP